jgi:hypothetical protein
VYSLPRHNAERYCNFPVEKNQASNNILNPRGSEQEVLQALFSRAVATLSTEILKPEHSLKRAGCMTALLHLNST